MELGNSGLAFLGAGVGAGLAIIGAKIRADVGQGWREVANELQRRRAQVALEPILVGVEPVTVVVLLQVVEKLERFWRQARAARHLVLPR